MYFYLGINTLTAIACITGAVLVVLLIDKAHQRSKREQSAKNHFKNQ